MAQPGREHPLQGGVPGAIGAVGRNADSGAITQPPGSAGLEAVRPQSLVRRFGASMLLFPPGVDRPARAARRPNPAWARDRCDLCVHAGDHCTAKGLTRGETNSPTDSLRKKLRIEISHHDERMHESQPEMHWRADGHRDSRAVPDWAAEEGRPRLPDQPGSHAQSRQLASTDTRRRSKQATPCSPQDTRAGKNAGQETQPEISCPAPSLACTVRARFAVALVEGAPSGGRLPSQINCRRPRRSNEKSQDFPQPGIGVPRRCSTNRGRKNSSPPGPDD